MPTNDEQLIELTKAGTVLRITRAASVQFAVRPILLRVIRRHDWTCDHGWVWLDGYELNAAGDAVERRSIYVQIMGLTPAGVVFPPRTSARMPRPRAAARNGALRGGGGGDTVRADLEEART